MASRSSIWQAMSLRYWGISAVSLPTRPAAHPGHPAAMAVKIPSAVPGLPATSAARARFSPSPTPPSRGMTSLARCGPPGPSITDAS